MYLHKQVSAAQAGPPADTRAAYELLEPDTSRFCASCLRLSLARLSSCHGRVRGGGGQPASHDKHTFHSFQAATEGPGCRRAGQELLASPCAACVLLHVRHRWLAARPLPAANGWLAATARSGLRLQLCSAAPSCQRRPHPIQKPKTPAAAALAASGKQPSNSSNIRLNKIFGGSAEPPHGKRNIITHHITARGWYRPRGFRALPVRRGRPQICRLRGAGTTCDGSDGGMASFAAAPPSSRAQPSPTG